MLKVILKSLDDADEALRGFYKEITLADGSTAYQIQLEGLDAHSDVRALKNAHETQKTRNATLRTEVEQLKARVEGLPEDFDATAYEQLKAQAEAKPGDKPNHEEMERIITARVDTATKKLNADLASRDEQITQLKSERDTNRRNQVLNEALAEAGVTDPVYYRAARALLKDQLKVVEDDDGTFSVLAFDPEMQIERPAVDFIKAWSESDEGKAFVGARANAGGGGDGGDPKQPGSQNNPWKRDTLNLTEQARIERENPALAQRLKAEAGVK